MNKNILNAWNERNKLFAEAACLRVKGRNSYAEGNRLFVLDKPHANRMYAEGDSLFDKSDELYSKGEEIFNKAVKKQFGDIEVKYFDGAKTAIVDGVVYRAEAEKIVEKTCCKIIN